MPALLSGAPPSCVAVRLRVSNCGTLPFASVSMAKPQLGGKQSLTPFPPLHQLMPGTAREVDFLLDQASRRVVDSMLLYEAPAWEGNRDAYC
ncbi:MAG: hypothetical protein SGPRY_014314 [Prymnesium sp.]